MPDISYIVPLANFFGVTTDELFDIAGRDSQKEMDEYEKRRFDLWHAGNVRGALELCREVNVKYPKNYVWLEHLADALLHVIMYSPGFSNEERESALPEALAICERIMEDCTDDEIRARCRQTLVMLYDKNGEIDKALCEAEKAPTIYFSREALSGLMWSSNEKTIEINSNNILTYASFLTNAITSYNGKGSDEIAVKRYQTAIAIWKLIFDDENYLLYHGQIGHLYKMLACSYARLSKREKAYESLKKAMLHLQNADLLPEAKTYYTGTFIKHCYYDPDTSTKNYSESNVALFKRDVLSSSVFASYLDDPEFIKIIE